MTAIVPSSGPVTGADPSPLARVLRSAVGLAILACQSWLAASTGYLLALLAAGARYSDPAPERDAGEPPYLAVLVPAHDEEKGVAAAVRPLVEQDYPSERLDVIVIADNCTDDTAAVAAAAGATVWERHDLSARGKGQALGWALARLRGQPRRPEAVLVVDADCIASANLCAVVAEEIADRQRPGHPGPLRRIQPGGVPDRRPARRRLHPQARHPLARPRSPGALLRPVRLRDGVSDVAVR